MWKCSYKVIIIIMMMMIIIIIIKDKILKQGLSQGSTISVNVYCTCKCVLYYCHRASTQLQLYISYHIYMFGRGFGPVVTQTTKWMNHILRHGQKIPTQGPYNGASKNFRSGFRTYRSICTKFNFCFIHIYIYIIYIYIYILYISIHKNVDFTFTAFISEL
jgi:hypothetical protein